MSITRRKFGIVTASVGVAVAARKNRSDGDVHQSGALQGDRRRGFSQGDLTVADEVCDEKLIEHQYLARSDLPGPQI